MDQDFVTPKKTISSRSIAIRKQASAEISRLPPSTWDFDSDEEEVEDVTPKTPTPKSAEKRKTVPTTPEPSQRQRSRPPSVTQIPDSQC